MLAASAALAARAQTLPEPVPAEPIRRCVVETLKVDGVPLVEHRWCVWTPKGWVALISDEGQRRVFGVKPWADPPIPKRQRRME